MDFPKGLATNCLSHSPRPRLGPWILISAPRELSPRLLSNHPFNHPIGNRMFNFRRPQGLPLLNSCSRVSEVHRPPGLPLLSSCSKVSVSHRPPGLHLVSSYSRVLVSHRPRGFHLAQSCNRVPVFHIFSGLSLVRVCSTASVGTVQPKHRFRT